jgi:hypothetical protein
LYRCNGLTRPGCPSANPSLRWVAEALNMGHPGAVRGHVLRQNQRSAD